ncbi:Tryptophan 2_3-dioxygenase, partial [Caligus rogercresseyi]
QILVDIDSVIDLFKTEGLDDRVDEGQMKVVNSRLYRVVRILEILGESINLLQTMTPSDFLNFRDVLINCLWVSKLPVSNAGE